MKHGFTNTDNDNTAEHQHNTSPKPTVHGAPMYLVVTCTRLQSSQNVNWHSKQPYMETTDAITPTGLWWRVRRNI